MIWGRDPESPMGMGLQLALLDVSEEVRVGIPRQEDVCEQRAWRKEGANVLTRAV